MKPEKAKQAIILTAVIAVLLELICMAFLLDWVRIPGKKKEPTQDSSGAVSVSIPSARPSADDLRGCSDKLTFPKESSYLAQYETYTVQPETGQKAYLLYKPEPLRYTSDRIMDLDKDTVVTGIAKENGFTLVKIQDGVAGWLPTQELQSH